MKIELKNVSFKYKKKLPLVLDDLSYAFESGNLYVLRGENGSGKTTLGKLIMGLLEPDEGLMLFDGKEGKKIKAAERATRIGYMFQNPAFQIFAPTVYDELTFPYEITKTLTPKTLVNVDQILKRFNLYEAKSRSPLTMSYGEMQRLALAGIMLRNIDFLLLDEPSSALDNNGRDFLIKFLIEFVSNGGGVILISHDTETLEKLEGGIVVTLKKGKLTVDSTTVTSARL